MQLLRIGSVLLIACGGGGAEGVDVEDLEETIIDASCAFQVRCERMPDVATCAAASSIGDDYATILAAVERGTITYDGDAARACVDAITAQACTFGGFHAADPCDAVFTGVVEPGAACFVDLECAGTGTCDQLDPACDPELACCAGTCAAGLVETGAGGPCADEVHVCALGTYCKAAPAGGAGTCTAVLTEAGAVCDELDACANPMYCNLSFTGGTATCMAAAASDASCSRDALLPCADNRDYCDPVTLTCVRGAAVGAACDSGVECTDYATCIAGTCVAKLGAGQACAATAGPRCLGALTCVDGACALPPPDLVCR